LTKGGSIEQDGGLVGWSKDDFNVGISQYGTDIESTDYKDRAYIFGLTSFAITSITFQVDGVAFIPVRRYISAIEIRPFHDNFDFTSNSPIAQAVNDLLKPLLDPYSLGRKEVSIEFFGNGKSYQNYHKSDFDRDQNAALKISRTSSTDLLPDLYPGNIAKDLESITEKLAGKEGKEYLENLASDVFLSYSHNGMNVIYGSPSNDELDGSTSSA
jgi:hypothetical protein